MANVSSPLRGDPALTSDGIEPVTHRVRRTDARRRPVFALVLAAIVVPLFFGPTSAFAADQKPGQSPDQAKQRREEIRKQQSQIAADLQPLTATDDELNKALQATNTQVRSQQA